jgi:sulfopyruvate decarboxylase TPP-binding subunit
LVDALESAGVTHVVGLPDSTLGPVFDRIEERPSIRLVRVAREGEAFAVASGLWLGGRRACVAVQNTGLLESGDALRGTASRMGVPLLVLVGYRGFAKLGAAALDPPPSQPDADHLSRVDVDSVALMTEPTLHAWGVPFSRLRGNAVEAVRSAVDRAERERRPVALLLTSKLPQVASC